MDGGSEGSIGGLTDRSGFCCGSINGFWCTDCGIINTGVGMGWENGDLVGSGSAVAGWVW